MQLMDIIPTLDLSDIELDSSLQLLVCEVYSPSHFWIQILGENNNIAVETIMDEMKLVLFI